MERTKPYEIAIRFDMKRGLKRRLFKAIVDRFENDKRFKLRLTSEASITSMTTITPYSGIFGTFSPEEAAQLKSMKIPFINFTAYNKNAPKPLITSDYIEIAKLAFDYFKTKGFQHYALFYHDTCAYGLTLHEELKKLCKSQGFTYNFRYIWAQDDEAKEDLKAWIARVPKPSALIIQDDFSANWLSPHLIDHDFHIPDDFATLSIDNDDVYCYAFLSPLSSIELNIEGMGRLAADKMKSAILNRKSIKASTTRFKPIKVVERLSSSIYAIEDTDVAQALQFINDHAAEAFSIEDLLAAVPVSRRKLEQKFKLSLNRTIMEEINRMHVEHAKNLLLNTTLNTLDVAIRAGFHNAITFNNVFKRVTGTTPAAWRKANF